MLIEEKYIEFKKLDLSKYTREEIKEKLSIDAKVLDSLIKKYTKEFKKPVLFKINYSINRNGKSISSRSNHVMEIIKELDYKNLEFQEIEEITKESKSVISTALRNLNIEHSIKPPRRKCKSDYFYLRCYLIENRDHNNILKLEDVLNRFYNNSERVIDDINELNIENRYSSDNFFITIEGEFIKLIYK